MSAKMVSSTGLEKWTHGVLRCDAAITAELLIRWDTETDKFLPRSFTATCLTEWKKLGRNYGWKLLLPHCSLQWTSGAFFRSATESLIVIVRCSCSKKEKCCESKKDSFIFSFLNCQKKKKNPRGWLKACFWKETPWTFCTRIKRAIMEKKKNQANLMKTFVLCYAETLIPRFSSAHFKICLAQTRHHWSRLCHTMSWITATSSSCGWIIEKNYLPHWDIFRTAWVGNLRSGTGGATSRHSSSRLNQINTHT